VEKLEATRKAAHDTGQFGAAVSATKEIAIRGSVTNVNVKPAHHFTSLYISV
jgi:hypothetical protein